MLLALGGEVADLEVKALPWSGITQVTLGGFDMLVSRTGYTGERWRTSCSCTRTGWWSLWHALLEVGDPFGVKPCGLAARDSLRMEAGLPLYGHEMAGPLNLTMADAGFGTYVKLYKPFFVGREAFAAREHERDAEVVRFRVTEKGQPRPQAHDPVVDDRGKVVGQVTSCAIDAEGYLLGQAYVRTSAGKRGTSALGDGRAASRAERPRRVGDGRSHAVTRQS